MTAAVLNFTSLIVGLYAIYVREYWVMVWFGFVGIANRKLIENGDGINKQKRDRIIISVFLIIAILFAYSTYMMKVRDNQIIGGIL